MVCIDTYCSGLPAPGGGFEEMDDRIGLVLFLTPAKSPPETGDTERLGGINGETDLELTLKAIS